jgi:acyl-CoA synthetase (AMP-forming)/AMP-acid ligase II
MLKDVLDTANFGRYDRSSLRKIFYSAAPMPSVLLKRAIERFGPIFTQFYGATESGAPATTLHRHQHHLEGPEAAVRRLTSAGQAMNGCEIRIVDDAGADCGPQEPGEILVRSDALMLGYWSNPEATAETFADGWLRTGDIGVFDEEAFVFIVDRKKDMIVSGGENIYSREVEEALLSHEDIAEAAVVGRPDPRWGEAVVAFIVCRPEAQLTADAIEEHFRKLIAAYKRPKDVRFVDELPKLPNGKIEKTKLRQML